MTSYLSTVSSFLLSSTRNENQFSKKSGHWMLRRMLKNDISKDKMKKNDASKDKNKHFITVIQEKKD